MAENIPKKVPLVEEDDDESGGSGSADFQWQSRLYEVYELIHDQHKGEKSPVDGFTKDQANNFGDDPIVNRDLHPLAHEAYFSGIDNTADNAVPSENTDPNVRAELRKQLDYKLQLQLGKTPTNSPKPSPF